MMIKKDVYVVKGAKEVWFCEDGQMRFYDHQGKRDVSALCPAFPPTVEP